MDDINAQAEKDARYKREWDAWFAKLPLRERRKMESLGLSSPEINYAGNMRSADISEMQLSNDPSSDDSPTPKSTATEIASDLLRRLISDLIGIPNPGLTLDCLLIVLKIGDRFPSHWEIARRNRVMKKAVPTRIAELQSLRDTLLEHHSSCTSIVDDLLRRIFGEIISLPNPSLTLDCLAILLSIGTDIPTETALARKHRVTRAAVSKRCITLMDTFQLSPPGTLKSKRSRSTYSRTQKQTHAKRIKLNCTFRPRAIESR